MQKAEYAVTINDIVLDADKFWVARASYQTRQGVDVMRLRAEKKDLPVCAPGDCYVLKGSFEDHATYGRQFRVTELLEKTKPTGALIKQFLSSGRGIGKKTVDRIWDAYGDSVIDLLEDRDVDSLSAIPRVSPALATALVRAWHDNSVKTELIQFLQECFDASPKFSVSHALTLAHKISDFYGLLSIEKLKEDPYRLWAFAKWKDCELLANALGVQSNDPRRLRCAVEEALYRLYEDGHTAVPPLQLDQQLKEVLGEDHHCQAIFEANNEDSGKPARIVTLNGLWALPGPAAMETYIADQLIQRSEHFFNASKDLNLDDYTLPSGFPLDDYQKKAVGLVFDHPIVAISGPAGSGKTSVLYAINDHIRRTGAQVLQVALSGKAAQRLMQATNEEAFTIDSLLAKVKAKPDFLDQYGLTPILHIDEASMVNMPLLYRVLRVFEGRALRLVFIGDPSQLSPIGPGVVFQVILTSERIPSIQLKGNHRQGEGSSIINVAAQVRAGQWPEGKSELGDDVEFIECGKAELLDATIKVYRECLAQGNKAYIVGMTRNIVARANDTLHRICCDGAEIIPEAPEFALGDPVIYKKNNYPIGLVNGSTGVIKSLGNGKTITRTHYDQTIEIPAVALVEWDHEGPMWIALSDIKSESEWMLQHSYAITCHQAQGSEFDICIIPAQASKFLLDRSWVYTAITRAKKKVIVLGDLDAARVAVEETGNFFEHRSVGLRL